MINTTQCYIVDDDKVLMMYRNKKTNDLNIGKWLGVGGKVKENEAIIDCMKREVLEETGLIVDEYIDNGVVLFKNDNYQELMFVFTITKFHGELTECDEGTLEWVDINDLFNLPMWEGDYLILQKVIEGSRIDFELRYSADKLVSVKINNKSVLCEESMNSFYMNIALNEAKIAKQDDEVPIGAIIVKDGEIIARAHNTRQADQISTHHAEILCIEEACRKVGSWRLEGCTLFVTLEPCSMCAGAIIQSRIDTVVYGASDRKGGFFGGLTDIKGVQGLNHYPKVIGGVLEQEAKELLKNFFKVKR